MEDTFGSIDENFGKRKVEFPENTVCVELDKKYRIVTIYEIYQPALGPGETSNSLGKFFSTQKGAKKAAKGKRCWGDNAVVWPQAALFINGKYFLLKSTNPVKVDKTEQLKEDAKKRAMEKLDDALKTLSKEERKAIGL